MLMCFICIVISYTITTYVPLADWLYVLIFDVTPRRLSMGGDGMWWDGCGGNVASSLSDSYYDWSLTKILQAENWRILLKFSPLTGCLMDFFPGTRLSYVPGILVMRHISAGILTRIASDTRRNTQLIWVNLPGSQRLA